MPRDQILTVEDYERRSAELDLDTNEGDIGGNVVHLRGHARSGTPTAHARLSVDRAAPDEPRDVARWLVERCGFRL